MNHFRCIGGNGQPISFWRQWDKVVRITGRENDTQNFQYTANLIRTITFTGVPADVKNIVAHFYRNNFVFFFLRAGEALVYNVNGDAPYINCYRTTNFLPTLNGIYPVSYNTQSSDNYIGKDPTWNNCIMNTCNLYDANGNLIFAKNAELSDFTYTT